MVATPIGNLADITLRALHVLAHVADFIACEDTRHTQQLMRTCGIDRPAKQLLALHQHNEREAAQAIVAHVQSGARVAYVSDAGTPGVSDPGGRLAAAVYAAGLRVVPLPGASCVTTLISAVGLSGAGAGGGFAFAGFLPVRAGEREQALAALARETRPIVLLEAPHRMRALAQSLAPLGPRPLTIGRELTKQFEEIATLAAADLSAWLDAAPGRLRGEFALVLHPPPPTPADEGPDPRAQQVLRLLLAHLPTKTAVRLAAEITGAPRNALYALALQERPSD